MSGTIFVGQIVDSKSFDELNLITEGFIAVDSSGKICGIGPIDTLDSWEHHSKRDFKKHILSHSQFLLPGFIDCHIHAPQTPNIGLGLDKPLLDWLQTYTFPLEAEYENVNFAQKIYRNVVRQCLNMGTTTACYFATIHRSACEVLVKEVIRQGQRAFVGKVSMDQLSPTFYMETLENSLKDNEDFIKYVLSLNNNLVKPIITPRFAITCSETLMKNLADMATRYDLLIQSHMSENVDEVLFVKETFPNAGTYAEVYEKHGLLTNKTIMAHCVHIESDEIDMFKKHETAAIHCPTSNTHLSSGLCDVKRILQKDVKVGLGTDVSGGNKIGIFDVIRHSLEVSQAIKFIKTQDIKGTGKMQVCKNEVYTPLSYKNGLYLATMGGALALSLEDTIGNFVIGKDFDALLVDASIEPIFNYDLGGTKLKENQSHIDKLESLVQKFIYVGDDRNIVEVFVKGKKVK